MRTEIVLFVLTLHELEDGFPLLFHHHHVAALPSTPCITTVKQQFWCFGGDRRFCSGLLLAIPVPRFLAPRSIPGALGQALHSRLSRTKPRRKLPKSSTLKKTSQGVTTRSRHHGCAELLWPSPRHIKPYVGNDEDRRDQGVKHWRGNTAQSDRDLGSLVSHRSKPSRCPSMLRKRILDDPHCVSPLAHNS